MFFSFDSFIFIHFGMIPCVLTKLRIMMFVDYMQIGRRDWKDYFILVRTNSECFRLQWWRGFVSYWTGWYS